MKKSLSALYSLSLSVFVFVALTGTVFAVDYVETISGGSTYGNDHPNDTPAVDSPIAIPIDFEFNGVSYQSGVDEICIRSDGILVFGSSCNYSGRDALLPIGILNSTTVSSVTTADRFVVRWEGLLIGNNVSVEVVLDGADNSVTYRYDSGISISDTNVSIGLYKPGFVAGTYNGSIPFPSVSSDLNDSIWTIVPVSSGTGSGNVQRTFNEDARCHWKKPEETTWIVLKPETKDGKAGIHATWTQYGADKVDIFIDDSTGNYPWKINDTSNDGHEFLPGVQKWQKIKIKPQNHCKEGMYSPAVSYSSHPNGWYNVKK